MKNIFSDNQENSQPLALKLRPTSLDDFVGQDKILGPGKVLRKLIEQKKLTNSIFYGPPGVGKTSLGEIISKELSYNFEILNATTSGVTELKSVVEKAKKNLEYYGKKTILFLDEIHRFNKLQQDSLLSSTESGTIILIGATTENPYYNLNNALLSRVLVFEFKPLTDKNIEQILKRGIKYLELDNVPEKLIEIIISMSRGDSRVAINYLELYENVGKGLDDDELLEIFTERRSSFHKEEDKYNIISAMIKSIRGSDPDSSVYWMGQLLNGGEDPRYVARRLTILASEDIGMANPEALLMATSALTASERIGMPEIRIILAQVAIYLAISTKSPSCYNAINNVLEDLKNNEIEKVPRHIDSNAQGYKYPHDFPNSFVIQKYSEKYGAYYIPGDNRNEKLIKEKQEKLWKIK
ncbi:MAG: replication-associated recombination protein A [Fusobacteriaceae bacterium]